MFGPNKEQVTSNRRTEKNYVIEILMICSPYQILFGDQI